MTDLNESSRDGFLEPLLVHKLIEKFSLADEDAFVSSQGQLEDLT
jgi:hypothetical protein